MICELQHETAIDNHLQLKEHIIKGWPENKESVAQNLRLYWTFSDDIKVIDRVLLKGRHIVIHDKLQKRALEELHINDMGMEKQNSLCVNKYISQVLVVILKNI